MTARRPLTCSALLLCALAFAGGVIHGNPTGIRPTRPQLAHTWVRPELHHRPAAPGPKAPTPGGPVHLSAPILSLRGVTLDGEFLDLDVPADLDLRDGLPLPAEPLAELEVTLAGPIVATAGQNLRRPDLDTLVLAIDDPEAAAVAGWAWIDLDGVTSDDLDGALRDGVLIVE